MPQHANPTDIMMLVGLGSIFLVIVFGGFRTHQIMETAPSPQTDAQGCHQAFNTLVAAGVLFALLDVLMWILQ